MTGIGREPEEKRNEETDVSSTAEGAWPSAPQAKIPVNSVKYEGKMEQRYERLSGAGACSAWRILNLIGESSAIIFFLRKSSSELSTSY